MRQIGALGAVGLLLGCSLGADSHSGPADNSDSAASRGSVEWVPWVIDSVPTLVIGDSGGPEYALARIWSAQRFSGGYVVTTGLPVGVRAYDKAGRFLRWLGRQGEGPGELRAISGTWVTQGDTVVVADHWQHRITYYHTDGDLIRTIRHEPGGSARVDDSRPRIVRGRFSDGSFLAIQSVMPPPPEGPRDEIVTGSARYFREIPSAESRDLITEVAEWDYAWDRRASNPFPVWLSVPFTPSVSFVTFDTLLVLADSRGFEVEIWSMKGRKVGTFTKEHEVRPLTDKVWNKERDRWLTEFSDRIEANGNRWQLNVASELAAIRHRFREESRLPTLPTHGTRMLAGPGGNLWIEAWSDDLGQRSSTWHIFLAESQRFVGTVEIPARFRPTAIYEDAILGVHTDELDVETVREYRIDRSPGLAGGGREPQ